MSVDRTCVRFGCKLDVANRRHMLCAEHFAEYSKSSVKPVDADQIAMELTQYPCVECGKDRGKRPKYCSDACRHRANDKRKRKNKPCLRCGEPKEYGVRGARYCQTCRQAMGPVWAELETERSRLRQKPATRKRMPKVAEDGRIWCPACSQYLNKGAFGKFKAGKPPSRCTPCRKQYHHEYMLKQKYGIDLAEYHRISAVTGHKCSICGNRPKTKRLAVDHNHQTGEIRGLLCKRCNRDLLGAARDSVEMLERAAAYLRDPPARTGQPIGLHAGFVDPTQGGRE